MANIQLASKTVTGEAELQKLVLHLCTLSCWFEVTPEPDDQYTIDVKADVAHVAFAEDVDQAFAITDGQIIDLANKELPGWSRKDNDLAYIKVVRAALDIAQAQQPAQKRAHKTALTLLHKYTRSVDAAYRNGLNNTNELYDKVHHALQA